jgi:hypothetical protein
VDGRNREEGSMVCMGGIERREVLCGWEVLPVFNRFSTRRGKLQCPGAAAIFVLSVCSGSVFIANLFSSHYVPSVIVFLLFLSR